MAKIRIRDGYKSLSGDSDVNEFNDLEILDNDGRVMFNVSMDDDGNLSIDGGNVCKFNGNILSDKFTISPNASNKITLTKNKV